MGDTFLMHSMIFEKIHQNFNIIDKLKYFFVIIVNKKYFLFTLWF